MQCSDSHTLPLLLNTNTIPYILSENERPTPYYHLILLISIYPLKQISYISPLSFVLATPELYKHAKNKKKRQRFYHIN